MRFRLKRYFSPQFYAKISDYGERLLMALLIWRIKHIPNRTFVIFVGIVVGVVTAIGVTLLKNSVHSLSHLFNPHNHSSYIFTHFYYIFPVIGIVITILLSKYVFNLEPGHSITEIIRSIRNQRSKIRGRRMISNLITSMFTVGFGASAGLEAPSVITGAATGSNTGRLLRLHYRERTLLIGCGAAAALSAIFNAPIAGVIFAIEVLLAEINLVMFIPILISSVAGAVVSQVLIGKNIIFEFKNPLVFQTSHLLFYIGLGLVSGVFSFLFIKVYAQINAFVQSIKKINQRLLVVFALLMVIFLLTPGSFGEGYQNIKELMHGNRQQLFQNFIYDNFTIRPYLFLLFTLLLIVLKTVATSLTLSIGGSGGIFGPSLVIGGLVGFLYADLINSIAQYTVIPVAPFVLTGMCGAMSGIQFAPLTAIFMIAEITGGYNLFIPLMLVSAISYAIVNVFEPYSIYTKKMIESGELVVNDSDKDVLKKLKLKSVISNDFKILKPNQSLGTLIEILKEKPQTYFPIIDETGRLVGEIELNDVKHLLFDAENYENKTIKMLMHSPRQTIKHHDSVDVILNKFEECETSMLSVVENGIYIGVATKTKVFNAYRKKLIVKGI